MHAHVTKFDERLSELVLQLPVWVTPFMNFVTLIGQPVFLIIFAAILALAGLDKNRPFVAYSAAASILAMAGNTALKHVFQRQRPDTIYVENMLIKSYSFPSGHAFGAAVFYGLLAYLSYVYLPPPWNMIAAAALVFLVFAIGVSRIYLGAHFPSDVCIGWLLGLASLFVIVKVLHP